MSELHEGKIHVSNAYVSRSKMMRAHLNDVFGLSSKEGYKTVSALMGYSESRGLHYEDVLETLIDSMRTYLVRNPGKTASEAAKEARDWFRNH